ncbi:unnamed protein product [Prorocentrum cordatum]|uniref:Pentatricopeptide repeat-containing protein n=1 Tax=Prorocentrum cordatum TaxID=2364126 RepID=A0ABN9PMY4_9DINO|nr:unnamed protein product [Polarella glacialis]
MREATLEPDVTIIYSAGISACERGQQWQRALSLLSQMVETKLEPTVINYSVVTSACQQGQQWQLALSLLNHIVETNLEPDKIYGISLSTVLGSALARKVSSGSRPRFCSARWSRRDWSPLSSATVLGSALASKVNSDSRPCRCSAIWSRHY